MTRENKLALVVGFALILFVGILISDHFSTASNQASADFSEQRPNDPLLEVRRNDPNLIDRRDRPRNTPASNTTNIPDHQQSQDDVPPRPEPPTIRMGPPEIVSREETAPQNPPFLFHDVKSGETLTSISRRYYGDESFALPLAKFNDIDDPSSLRVNHRLRIPAAESLGGASSASSTPRDSQPALTTYTVRSGDSLSDIAQRLLGSSRRWRDIYELNRDVISDPDNVRVGTELKIPR